MDGKYSYSVFYLTHSVFENVLKELESEGNQNNYSTKFLIKISLINARYRGHIGMHVTYTTKQILDLVKDVDTKNRFIGLMQLGKNMVFPEENEMIKGDKNYRLLQFASYKDGEIEGNVKVVSDNYETTKYFEKMVLERDYPVKIVSSEGALTEILEIEKKLEGL